MAGDADVTAVADEEGGGAAVVESAGLLRPVDPSFRALSGRLKFTVRRHTLNKYSLSKRNLDWLAQRR